MKRSEQFREGFRDGFRKQSARPQLAWKAGAAIGIVVGVATYFAIVLTR